MVGRIFKPEAVVSTSPLRLPARYSCFSLWRYPGRQIALFVLHRQLRRGALGRHAAR